MKEHRILPFYMTYPMPMAYGDDKDVVRDLEYFEQLYPNGSKMLQREVAKALGIIDYEGSIIYDEYPDRLRLQKLSRDILDRIRKQGEANSKEIKMLLEFEGIEDYLFLILLNELLKRRHRSDRGYLRF